MTHLTCALILTSLVACEALEPVPVGTCGNLVVEANEQCDGQDGCARDGADACRFTCELGVVACPGELACGARGVCTAPTNRFVPYSEVARYDFVVAQTAVGDLDGDHRDDLVGVGSSLRVRYGGVEAPLLESYEKPIRPPTGPASFGELDDVRGLDVVVPTADGIFTLLARGRSFDAVPYASVPTLPDDAARACPPTAGKTGCARGDFDRDGQLDRVEFTADRDNLAITLTRATTDVTITIDTIDLVTDVTTGDLDGDGFADIAFATRSANGLTDGNVEVLYGAPQVQTQQPTTILRARDVTGIAAGEVNGDGLADLGVAREIGGSVGVALYLGNSARDLSAPFRLDRSPQALDVPFAVVVGEFVGGPGSGVDVMAYARNPDDTQATYFWWLRGVGNAQLEVGAIDQVEDASVAFLASAWKVANLVADPSTGNGPDEVIGLSSSSATCAGPAVTVAVPSARFTSTDLVQNACLELEGTGWSAQHIAISHALGAPRAIAIAQRGNEWWIGETSDLGGSLERETFEGSVLGVADRCRDPQVWSQTPSAGTFVSWVCDRDDGANIVGVRHGRDGANRIEVLATVPAGATHLPGDFDGDGLTDLVVRVGEKISVLPQCATDTSRPGC